MAPFQKMMSRYAQIDHFVLKKNATEREVAVLRKTLDNYNLIIAGIQGINLYPSGATEPVLPNGMHWPIL
jgi:beta-N-acetylhexosaminidase